MWTSPLCLSSYCGGGGVQDINHMRASIEQMKNDVIKYCVGMFEFFGAVLDLADLCVVVTYRWIIIRASKLLICSPSRYFRRILPSNSNVNS